MNSEEYRNFYEKVGRLYPEEELVYSTPSGILRRRFVMNLLNRYAGSPHLDVGCGGGIYLANMTKDVVGVDISVDVLKRAVKRNPSGMYVVGDARELSFFRGDTFSSVLMSEVIEHFEGPETFFEGAHRILAPGGHLVITTPNYRGKRPEYISSGILNEFGVDEELYFHTAYRPEELVAMAEKAGFFVIESGTFEKGLKYWYRAIFELSKPIELIFGRKLAVKTLSVVRNGFFRILGILGIVRFLERNVKEGGRSYLVARK